MAGRRKALRVGALVRPLATDAGFEVALERIAAAGDNRRRKGKPYTDAERLTLVTEAAYWARWLPNEVGVVTEVYPRTEKYQALVRFGAQCSIEHGDRWIWTREYLFARDELSVL